MLDSIEKIISRKEGRDILLDYKLPLSNAIGVIVFAHGHKGFKDWGAWNLIAEYFAEQGFVFLKFNFSLNGGTLENPIDFPDPEAFGQNNFYQELLDLEDVIDFSIETFKVSRVHLIGHSRGGGLVLCKGLSEKVQSIHSWAGVTDFFTMINDDFILDWETKGVTYIENKRTLQKLPIYKQFYDALLENQEALDIRYFVKQSELPLFFIHGSKDEAISLADAEMLSGLARNGKFQEVEDGGHTFGASHPFSGGELPYHSLLLCEWTLKNIKEL